MRFSWVLVSRTRGDELEPSQRNLVAVSDDRQKLEQLRTKRDIERRNWLSTHKLPDYVLGSVIVDEAIEEVLSL